MLNEKGVVLVEKLVDIERNSLLKLSAIPLFEISRELGWHFITFIHACVMLTNTLCEGAHLAQGKLSGCGAVDLTAVIESMEDSGSKQFLLKSILTPPSRQAYEDALLYRTKLQQMITELMEQHELAALLIPTLPLTARESHHCQTVWTRYTSSRVEELVSLWVCVCVCVCVCVFSAHATRKERNKRAMLRA